MQHIEKTNPAARNFINELSGVKEAARIDTKFLLSEVTQIKENVTAIQVAIEAVAESAAADANPPNDRFLDKMRPFYTNGQSRVASIVDRLKSTQLRCSKLSKYLGEPDLAPESLFAIFVTFIGMYQMAEGEVKREREMAETRRKNRELQATLKGNKTNK